MYNPVNIKLLMVANGLSVQEIASRTGLSLPTVYSVLRGADVRTSTLELVAKAIGVGEAAFYLPISESKLSSPGGTDDRPAA